MLKINSLGLSCVLCAGGLCSVGYADGFGPVELESSSGNVNHVAHIYYNVSSGERVVSLLGDGQVSGADTGESVSLWSVRETDPCGQGSTAGFFFVLDDNSGTTSLASGATLLDWGDLPMDTVVDCVHVHWVTDHDDVDADSDGIGDGVVGLSGQWTFWDADNGRAINGSTREPVVSFIFTDLPGDTSGTTDPDDPSNTFAKYTADVDLGGSASSSLVFELGDSDGDLQGAAFGSNNIDTDSDGIGDGVSIAAPGVDRDFDGNDDADLDGDGRFDWGWSVLFRQPGTADLDEDGVNEGDLTDSMKGIGLSIALPAGELIDNGDGTWSWDILEDGEGSGPGSEDAYALFDQNGDHAGVFWFGGFSCTPGAMNARASFEMELFGPGEDLPGCNAADIAEPYGVLDFFDTSAFLSAYNAQEEAGDFAEPFGVWDFFDVSGFLGMYNAGCP